ncbi:MAG: class IV adenylate cyclase [Anaerolineales bacterium]
MREIEAKFFVSRLELVRRRAIRLGGRLTARRHLESNLHFDLPGDPLAKQHSLLRLRQDKATTLAYKHRGRFIESREEFELRVADSAAAVALLTALGYRVVASYEKYRREYSLGPVQVMLDELPFGNFVEIEGPTLQLVRRQAGRLGLAWTHRVRSTYLELLDQLRQQHSLRFREGSFDRFAALPEARADRIGLRDAIRPEADDR